MTMSPHMLHAHTHNLHSTQLAQAYTCSPTTKVGKKTATTITQLCNYTSQSAHTTTTPLVACCCWWAWKSSAAEAGLWVWKSLVPETGFGKAQGVGKSPLNWKVLEKMDQPEGPPNKKGRKFGHGTTSQARKERRKGMQWSALEKADPTDPTVLAKHLEALEKAKARCQERMANAVTSPGQGAPSTGARVASQGRLCSPLLLLLQALLLAWKSQKPPWKRNAKKSQIIPFCI